MRPRAAGRADARQDRVCGIRAAAPCDIRISEVEAREVAREHELRAFRVGPSRRRSLALRAHVAPGVVLDHTRDGSDGRCGLVRSGRLVGLCRHQSEFTLVCTHCSLSMVHSAKKKNQTRMPKIVESVSLTEITIKKRSKPHDPPRAGGPVRSGPSEQRKRKAKGKGKARSTSSSTARPHRRRAPVHARSGSREVDLYFRGVFFTYGITTLSVTSVCSNFNTL